MNKIRIGYLFTFICLFNLTADINLPFTIPADSTSLSISYQSDPIDYEIQIDYSLNELSKKIKNQSVSLLIPLPTSNDFQQTTIIDSGGINIVDFQRDKQGNVVLISEMVRPNNLPKVIRLKLAITTRPGKILLPKQFQPQLKINQPMLDQLLVGNNEISDNYKKIILDFPPQDELDFNQLMEVIEQFKKLINQNKNHSNRLYADKVMNLYPISNQQYFEAAQSLLHKLAKAKISGRISRGYYIPYDIALFYPDFVIELFIPDQGWLVLDKYLNALNTNGGFVSFFYPVLQDGNNQFISYIAALLENEKVIFLNETNTIRIGIKSSDGFQDKRFTNVYDEKTVYQENKSDVSKWLLPEISYQNEQNILV
ncbi:MAG: hypothetical protein MJB14_10470, partial [Spirochaetes bacterium]|nr:hypothetical protein [Spirochaetota bacterium]